MYNNNIQIYAVHRNIEHRNDCERICFNVDHPLRDEEIVDVIQRYVPNYLDVDTLIVQMKEKCETINICSKCKMFIVGLFDDVIIDDYCIHHRYYDPILKSVYHPINILGNSIHVEDIKSYHIHQWHVSLQELGTPETFIDKEAYDTTINCLNFIEAWSAFPKVRLIMRLE